MNIALKLLTRIAFRQLRQLIRCRRGVSAVEFSLLAPVLTLGLFATVDAGMAVYDKMMMTQVLRSGAHSAIAAESEDSMMDMLRVTASDNFVVVEDGETPAVGELLLSVNTYCICPNDRTTVVDCDSTCTGGGTIEKYFALSADMEFDGVILPNFALSGEIDIYAQ